MCCLSEALKATTLFVASVLVRRELLEALPALPQGVEVYVAQGGCEKLVEEVKFVALRVPEPLEALKPPIAAR